MKSCPWTIRMRVVGSWSLFQRFVKMNAPMRWHPRVSASSRWPSPTGRFLYLFFGRTMTTPLCRFYTQDNSWLSFNHHAGGFSSCCFLAIWFSLTTIDTRDIFTEVCQCRTHTHKNHQDTKRSPDGLNLLLHCPFGWKDTRAVGQHQSTTLRQVLTLPLYQSLFTDHINYFHVVQFKSIDWELPTDHSYACGGSWVSDPKVCRVRMIIRGVLPTLGSGTNFVNIHTGPIKIQLTESSTTACRSSRRG
jgi:hypothetical protein